MLQYSHCLWDPSDCCHRHAAYAIDTSGTNQVLGLYRSMRRSRLLLLGYHGLPIGPSLSLSLALMLLRLGHNGLQVDRHGCSMRRVGWHPKLHVPLEAAGQSIEVAIAHMLLLVGCGGDLAVGLCDAAHDGHQEALVHLFQFRHQKVLVRRC